MECFSIKFVLTLDIDMSLDVQNPRRLNPRGFCLI